MYCTRTRTVASSISLSPSTRTVLVPYSRSYSDSVQYSYEICRIAGGAGGCAFFFNYSTVVRFRSIRPCYKLCLFRTDKCGVRPSVRASVRKQSRTAKGRCATAQILFPEGQNSYIGFASLYEYSTSILPGCRATRYPLPASKRTSTLDRVLPWK